MAIGIPKGVPAHNGLWRTGSEFPWRGSVQGLASTGLWVCMALSFLLSGSTPLNVSAASAASLYGTRPPQLLRTDPGLVIYTRGVAAGELLQMAQRLLRLGVPYRLELEGDPRADWLRARLASPSPLRLDPPFERPGGDPRLLEKARAQIG